jgi:hypothetical protein
MAKRPSSGKRNPARKTEVRGRIQAPRARAEYARRVDPRVSSEIDRAVAQGAQLRTEIVDKIESGLHQRRGAQLVGLSKRRRR